MLVPMYMGTSMASPYKISINLGKTSNWLLTAWIINEFEKQWPSFLPLDKRQQQTRLKVRREEIVSCSLDFTGIVSRLWFRVKKITTYFLVEINAGKDSEWWAGVKTENGEKLDGFLPTSKNFWRFLVTISWLTCADLICSEQWQTFKPSSHLCDKHNTSDITTSISTRKKEHVPFFLCLCLCLCRLCYAYRTSVNQA